MYVLHSSTYGEKLKVHTVIIHIYSGVIHTEYCASFHFCCHDHTYASLNNLLYVPRIHY